MAVPSSANVTITGKIGPGLTNTSVVFSGIRGLEYQFDKSVLRVVTSDGRWVDYDLYQVTTITYTIGAHVGTITVS